MSVNLVGTLKSQTGDQNCQKKSHLEYTQADFASLNYFSSYQSYLVGVGGRGQEQGFWKYSSLPNLDILPWAQTATDYKEKKKYCLHMFFFGPVGLSDGRINQLESNLNILTKAASS